jgi:hypothetical protein
MSWKKSFDKYLSTPPDDDDFDYWYDEVIDKYLSDDFYKKYENFIFEDRGHFNKWMNKLFFRKGKSPEEAARIIERLTKKFF